MMELLLALLAIIGFSVAIPTIEVKGSKLFTSDGYQFYVKGQQNTASFSLGLRLSY